MSHSFIFLKIVLYHYSYKVCEVGWRNHMCLHHMTTFPLTVYDGDFQPMIEACILPISILAILHDNAEHIFILLLVHISKPYSSIILTSQRTTITYVWCCCSTRHHVSLSHSLKKKPLPMIMLLKKAIALTTEELERQTWKQGIELSNSM